MKKFFAPVYTMVAGGASAIAGGAVRIGDLLSKTSEEPPPATEYMVVGGIALLLGTVAYLYLKPSRKELD